MHHMLMLASFVLFCVLALAVVAVCLLTPIVYAHPTPKTKKKVIELACDGVVAQWMIKNRWGAFTCPLPFVVLIFYWVKQNFDPIDPLVRVHEFVHVQQDEENACFLVSWINYGIELVRQRLRSSSWMEAYVHNKYEAAAYAHEEDVFSGRVARPDWA